MKKLSKKESSSKLENFFSNIFNKSSKEVKKAKRLAMSHNIKLKDKRKLFCKKCLTPYRGNEKVRINKDLKSITCKHCGYISHYRIKKS